MKIKLFFSNVVRTKFMQHADVFEPWKVLVEPMVSGEAPDDFSVAEAEKLAQKSQSEPYRLIACVCDKFTWIDPGVRVVSTGTNWAPVKDYLRAYGASVC